MEQNDWSLRIDQVGQSYNRPLKLKAYETCQ